MHFLGEARCAIKTNSIVNKVAIEIKLSFMALLREKFLSSFILDEIRLLTKRKIVLK